MITRTYYAETGCGLRHNAVAPDAVGANYSRITVISSLREIVAQWEHIIPQSDRLTAAEWRRRADDPAGTLVIADSIRPNNFANYAATLESVDADVWIVGFSPVYLSYVLLPTGLRHSLFAQPTGY